MTAALDGLSDAQRTAVTHPPGPLIVLGGAGSGKTTVLVRRFAWLVEQGAAPESILALTHGHGAADALRGAIETAIDRPYEELTVATVPRYCAQMLAREALAAGFDAFAEPVSPADRLALLLDHVDELPLRHHDFGGDAAALLAGFVRRIDRLKDELVSAADYGTWADGLPEANEEERARAAREREFAAVYRAHDRLLAEANALDAGELVMTALRILRERPHVRERLRGRHAHVLVDDFQDRPLAQVLLLRELAAEHGSLTVAGDDDQAIQRFRAAGAKNLRDLARELPGATTVRLEQSFRVPELIARAAAAIVEPCPDRIEKRLLASPGGAVELWRCANDRAQAQAVAADIERLIGRQGVEPGRIGVLVPSIEEDGHTVGVALEEHAVPHRLLGGGTLFQRAEVRDLLAWLRLLSDPGDAAAVVRALARPPIELRAVDIARCTQIARRRKLDMVAGLAAATESPQIPPEARERILGFLKLYRQAAGAFDTMRPDLYVHRLIERLGLRRQQLFAAQADVVERLLGLARFGDVAAAHARRSPQASARDFARAITGVAEAGIGEPAEPVAGARAVQVLGMSAAKGSELDHVYVLGLDGARMPGVERRALDPIPDALLREPLPPATPETHVASMRRLLHVALTRARERVVLVHPQASDRGAARPPSPLAEEARAAVGGEWEERAEELFGPAEQIHSTYRILRDEVLDSVARAGSRLSELRLDTDLDVSHAVVRYLELIKLAALIERPPEQPVEEALAAINARLLTAVTAEQREIYGSSTLDDYLLDAERDERRRAAAIAARDEPTLEAFLPRRGEGLVLSASDIETYRTCPLKYKFARVFRIPQEPTINQRFGILVHQVLERFHAAGGVRSLDELLGLLDAGWRRAGFGDSEQERQLRAKAGNALTRYHARFERESAKPIWFERSFSFKLGPHLLRGRVDRVDELPEGGYELIDYKTGRPKAQSDLTDDVQLSLYAVGAREAWQLDAASQAYYYVLDDEKVPVPRAEHDAEWVLDTALEVADGIRSQGFEPTPSFLACSACDYRLVCPAAER